MKKLILILVLALTLNVFSQHKDREHIKALKIAFITENLDLTKKEAQEFWPIYNEYESKTHQIRYKELRAIRKEIKGNIDTMSDAQANQLIKKLIAKENELHRLRTEFPSKLSKVISSKKILQLKVAEDDFKKKMFEELKRRKKERS